MPALGLDELANAYRRTQRFITRGMEDALEFNDEAQFDTLDQDRNIIDAAFFVLIFGQLERRITDLAIRKVQPQQRNAMREAKFEKRLEIALPNDESLRDEIESWYSNRNAPAHGSGIASGYEIADVLARARQIDQLLNVAL